MKSLKLLLILGLASLLGACAIHRMDIQQGNALTEETLDKLKIGMEQRIVRRLAGTPLITDPFRSNRWDYIYSYQPGGGVRGQERISVFFVNDELVSFSGDFVPSGTRRFFTMMCPR